MDLPVPTFPVSISHLFSMLEEILVEQRDENPWISFYELWRIALILSNEPVPPVLKKAIAEVGYPYQISLRKSYTEWQHLRRLTHARLFNEEGLVKQKRLRARRRHEQFCLWLTEGDIFQKQKAAEYFARRKELAREAASRRYRRQSEERQLLKRQKILLEEAIEKYKEGLQ